MSQISAHAASGSPPDGLCLGAFRVQPDGSLAAREPGAPPALRFSWRGRLCSATLGIDGLALSAEAGLVPSTAEAPLAREAVFGTLTALPAELPRGWEVRLTPGHGVRLSVTTALDGPATAAVLVTAMVRFALALDPYLALLGDAVGPAGSSPGSPSIWPG